MAAPSSNAAAFGTNPDRSDAESMERFSEDAQAPGPSRRLLNTAGRIVAAAAARSSGEDTQVLGFTPRDFVIFGLPYKNPKTSLYVRRNGALTFTITGGTHGVPYAQDRLLVIWLATVFKVCGSPETNAIAFDSLREVARSLGKASSGQQRQRIESGFLRLFDATFLASDSRPNAIRRERYQLLLPTLFPRLLVTVRHQPDVIGSRTAPSGGRSWKVAEMEKPRTRRAAGASSYRSGT